MQYTNIALVGIRGSRAVRCDGCRLHVDLCVCDRLQPLDVTTEVVVFMHALEAPRPSNTGHLVVTMLPHARVVMYGAKDEPLDFCAAADKRQLLLHPDGRPLCAADAAQPIQLFVADGTWHQAKRMARRIDALRDAERVSVAAPAMATAMRRDDRDGYVSTLEAVAYAIGVLESPAAEQAMRDVLKLVVARTMLRRYPPAACRTEPSS